VTKPKRKVVPPAAPLAVRRALVVDDEPTIRSAVARYLRRCGWWADEAEDGWVALQTLERAAPDRYHIVISDLRMPNYSGDQLHDWLAQHRPALFELLILTTGDLESPALKEFIGRTPRPIVEKPFELAALGRLVEEVATSRR
jgi:two-component system, cell cycle sensor histidine kinase and response regulator CckA